MCMYWKPRRWTFKGFLFDLYFNFNFFVNILTTRLTRSR